MSANWVELDSGVYCLEHDFTLAGGIASSTRATAVILPDNQIWLHSPVPMNADQKSKLDSLGVVKYLVAPNTFHHLFLHQTTDLYPDAEIWLANGVEKKLKWIEQFHLIGQKERPWEETLLTISLDGMPSFNESVFFHQESKTLIGADFLFNVEDHPQRIGRWILSLTGVLGRATSSRLFRFFIKDKASFHQSALRLQRLDFEKVVLSHGKIITKNSKEIFEEAYKNYL